MMFIVDDNEPEISNFGSGYRNEMLSTYIIALLTT